MLNRIKYNLKWKLHSINFKKLIDEHPLKYLFLEVTRQCNLKCIYCGSDCGASARGGEMPVEKWIDIARQIAQDFDPALVMIAITGGEPLLKKGIFELFFELQKLKFQFGMVSNGTLIDKDAASKLVQSGIGSISLSLDGTPEINDAIRGKGVADKIAAVVGYLSYAGYRGKLEAITTLTKPALPHLDAARKYLAGLKIPLWRIVPAIPIGRAANRPELILNDEDIRFTLEYIKKSRTDKLMPVPEFGEEGYLGDEFEGAVRPFLFQCLAGITIGGILYDGKLGACPELGEAFSQGHISKDRFKDVWNKEYGIFRNRDWTRAGECKSCDAYNRCAGGSLHLYEKPESPFIRCCYKMLQIEDGQ